MDEMNNITFGPGTLFVCPPDEEIHPIGDVQNMEFFEDVKDAYAVNTHSVLTSETATFTINLTQDQIDAFFEHLYSIREHVIDLVRAAGHHRIAHLASHSKKWRTRKKNLYRVYKIAKMEVF